MEHRLGGLNHRNVLSHRSGGQKFKIRVSARLVPSEDFKGGKGLSQASLLGLQVDVSSLSLHILFPQCLFVSTSKFPFCIRTPVISDYGPF